MPKSAPNYFEVGGLEPLHDPTWHTATPAQRAAYLRVCRVLVLTEWDKQMAAGLGADGMKLAPIKMATRMRRHSAMGPADPNAPPLIPAHELSRTRSLVDARVIRAKIRVFWRFDPISGMRWGTILGYHRDGKGNLPKRNVFGLHDEARHRVLQAAYHWWAGYSRGKPTRMPVRPRPGQKAKPSVTILPEYEPKTGLKDGETLAMKPITADVAIGGHIYTMSKGAAADLLSAIGGGRFTGFRSYAGVK